MKQRAPELELQAVVAQAAQLLVVPVVADGDDGQLGRLDAGDEVRHAAAVARTHAVHLVHDQAQLDSRTARECQRGRDKRMQPGAVASATQGAGQC